MDPTGKPIVHMVWRDATGGSRNGWRSIAQIAAAVPVVSHAYGVLICRDDEKITVLSHYNDAGEGDAEVTIPADWMVSIETLVPEKRRRK